MLALRQLAPTRTEEPDHLLFEEGANNLFLFWSVIDISSKCRLGK